LALVSAITTSSCIKKITLPGNHADRDINPDYNRAHLYEGAAKIASGVAGKYRAPAASVSTRVAPNATEIAF
jgi:hypothetical protein